MRPRKALRRHAFTLIESVVVFATLAIISAVVLVRLTGAANPGNDATAKTSLAVFQQIQLDAARSSGLPLDAAQISAAAVDRGPVGFTSGPSLGDRTVSVSVSGTVVVGLVRAGSDCWALRLDFAPSPDSPPLWWFVFEAAETCSGGLLAAAVFPADGTGQTASRPTVG